MASSVRERRDRAHLSCAAIPLVTPGSYRRGRLLLWVFGVVDLPAVPSVCLIKYFLFLLFSTWVGFAVVSSFLDSSRFLLPSLWFVVWLLVSPGSIGNPCGCRCSAPSLFLGLLGVLRCSGSLRAVFLHPRIFYPYLWTSRRACILAVFTAFSELRGVRQVERFAQCSFRHLRQVVFPPGG